MKRARRSIRFRYPSGDRWLPVWRALEQRIAAFEGRPKKRG